MKAIAVEIKITVERSAQAIAALSDQDFSTKSKPGKWSRKEIVGHLIDSAQNNIQRFVRGQYEHNPKIVYEQDAWVRLQGYQEYPKDELIQLWRLMNGHLCRVLLGMDPANYDRNCDTGGTSVQLHSLSYLAEDYLAHLHHHLDQIENYGLKQ